MKYIKDTHRYKDIYFVFMYILSLKHVVTYKIGAVSSSACSYGSDSDKHPSRCNSTGQVLGEATGQQGLQGRTERGGKLFEFGRDQGGRGEVREARTSAEDSTGCQD